MRGWSRRLAFAGAMAASVVGVAAVAGRAAEPMPTATANDEASRGIALGIPGVVVVGESTASSSSPDAHWTGLSVADTEVIGRNAANEWTGTAAPAGATLDGVNLPLCDPVAVGENAAAATCLGVFDSYSSTNPVGGSAYGSVVTVGALVGVAGGPSPVGAVVSVLPSRASSYGGCARTESRSSAGLATIALYNGDDYTEIPIANAEATNGKTC